MTTVNFRSTTTIISFSRYKSIFSSNNKTHNISTYTHIHTKGMILWCLFNQQLGEMERRGEEVEWTPAGNVNENGPLLLECVCALLSSSSC